MILKHIVLLAIVTTVATAQGISPVFGGSPSQLHASLAQAITEESNAAEAWQKWEKERASLEEQILKLKMAIAYLEHEKRKLEDYRNRAKKRLEGLEKQKRDSQELSLGLEGFLYDTVDRLDEAVRKDLPFHEKERLDRVASLKTALADYSLPLAEKTRRLLETLIAEARYGKTVEVYDGILEDGDKGQHVQFLRVGRLALFCAPPDRSFINFYDPTSRTWKPLPEDLKDQIIQAFEQLQKGDSGEFSEKDLWLTLPTVRERNGK